MTAKKKNMNSGGPIATVTRGLAAGFIGTVGMTVLQEFAVAVKRAHSDGSKPKEHQGDNPWTHAPAPAQVAKRILETLFHQEVHADRIKLLTNITHWAYGTGLGAMYALIERKLPFDKRPTARGTVYGTAAWAASYAMFVPMGLYQPPWHYPAKTIAKDLSYHLVYGAGCAAGYRRLSK